MLNKNKTIQAIDILIYFEKNHFDLDFFQIILIRMSLIKEPFLFLEFKYFLRLCSSRILKVFLSYLYSKYLLKWFCKKKKILLVDINFRELFFRMFYVKSLYFPCLNNCFKTNSLIFSAKNIKNLGKFDRKKVKTLLFFFNDLILSGKLRSSIQFILFLKTAGIVEKTLDPNEVRISKNGLKFILNDPGILFFNILENISKKGLFLPKKRLYLKSFFKIFNSEKESIFKNSIIGALSKNRSENVAELWYKIMKNDKLKANIIHGFQNDYNYIFWFFHEMKMIFFPRISDKIFYSFNIALTAGNVSYIKRSHRFEKNDRKFAKNFRLVVESNYRIYAYKNNDFLNMLLLQFSDLLYNLPNLFVGEITKGSINRAIKKGISSKNIIGFIEKNLHEICKNVPQTVVNQIRGWELQQKKTSISDSLMIFRTLKELDFREKSSIAWSVEQSLSKIKQKLVYFLKE
nr:TATA binding protein of transcription factor IIB-like protein [Cryptomonas sp.]